MTGWTTCTLCGKRTYETRKDARRAAKQLPGHHLSAYECAQGWHLGHLPVGVAAGHYSRADLGGTA